MRRLLVAWAVFSMFSTFLLRWFLGLVCALKVSFGHRLLKTRVLWLPPFTSSALIPQGTPMVTGTTARAAGTGVTATTSGGFRICRRDLRMVADGWVLFVLV